MFLDNILCCTKEFRLCNNNWTFYNSGYECVTSKVIDNMLDAGYYFQLNGGTQIVKTTRISNLGEQVYKITCISPCKSIMKIYKLSYTNAKYVW